jgi:hypothetical protein
VNVTVTDPTGGNVQLQAQFSVNIPGMGNGGSYN